MIPTREEFAQSIEAQKIIDIIYNVMCAGAEKHPWDGWKYRGASEHVAHATVHVCNVHHAQSIGLPDKETGLRQVDHALTRLAFCALLDEKSQKDAMRKMQEAVSE